MGKSKRSVAESQTAASKTDTLSFEVALEQLEGTVGRLESGDMPLEEALDLFEAGVQLSRQCAGTLEAAERRVEILVADRAGSITAFETDDDLDAEDFDHDDDEEDDEDDFED